MARLSELLEESCGVSTFWILACLSVTLAYWTDRLKLTFFPGWNLDWCWIQSVLSVIVMLGLNFRIEFFCSDKLHRVCMWKRCLDTVQLLEIPYLTLDRPGQPQHERLKTHRASQTVKPVQIRWSRKIVFRTRTHMYNLGNRAPLASTCLIFFFPSPPPLSRNAASCPWALAATCVQAVDATQNQIREFLRNQKKGKVLKIVATPAGTFCAHGQCAPELECQHKWKWWQTGDVITWFVQGDHAPAFDRVAQMGNANRLAHLPPLQARAQMMYLP